MRIAVEACMRAAPVERFTSLGNTLYIDTGAVFRGRDFTILDAATLRPVALRRPALSWEG